MYFHVRVLVNNLDISLPHELVLARLKFLHLTCTLQYWCDDCVNANETCMDRDWFYNAEYAGFRSGGTVTSRSPPDNLTQRIIAQSEDFIKMFER